MKTQIPADEPAPMDAAGAGVLSNAPSDSAFDELIRLAARICNAPLSAVSLVDADRQWFKARFGMATSEAARGNSFCAHAIAQERELFIVTDARADSRFASLRMVLDEPYVQFYAGARLLNSSGQPAGTLCVMDHVVRDLDAWQRQALQMLGRQVVLQLELQRELAAREENRQILESRQTQLRESEALYQSLVEHLPLFILRKDVEGRLTFANRLFCDALCSPLVELLGKTDFELFPKKIAAKIRDDDRRVLASGEALESIQELPQGKGQILQLQAFTAPIHDRQGRIAGVQIISRDVTERHRLEQQLRNAHEQLESRVRTRTAKLAAANASLTKAERQASELRNRYELIVASSGTAVYDIDRITGEVFWGSGAEKVLGLDPSTLNRASDEWLELVHPQDRQAVTRSTEDAIINGLSFDVQYRLRQDGDRYAWLQDRGFIVPDTQGRCIRVVGMMQDVTQRKIVEDTIREQAALLDQTQDAIMVRNMQNQVLYWNKTAESLFGWTAAEALGKAVHELILGGSLGHLPTAQVLALQQGEWSGETKVYTKDGKELTVQSRWKVLRDRDGKPYAFLVAHTDLTERKLLEAKFLRAQRLESVGALASGVAHDLNNVFTPILMSAQLLEDEVDEATQKRMLGILKDSARRGSEMVKQVLTFTRGSGDDAPGLVQIKHLIFELGKMMRDTFPRNITIETNAISELWPVRADATQLYQILMNLCINARDAMPDGGALHVGAANVQLEASPEGTSPKRKAGPHLLVSVADTGTGMTAEVKSKIFEPFFTTKEPGKGTGLGLSTVSTLVKAHSGFLELESEVGQGTRFSIYLPAEIAETAETGGWATEAPSGHGELLMVVDDESAIREILKATLEAHDYNVLLAEDGTEALSLYAIHREKIALVMTDIAMPVLNGYATIRALKKMNPDVKWIAVSGLTDPNELDQLADKTSAVLAKPYSTEKLLNTIHAVLHPAETEVGKS